MDELRRLREAAGASQIRIARLAGVPRMRLSLAETGDVQLNEEQETAVRSAICDFARATAAELLKIAQLAVTRI